MSDLKRLARKAMLEGWNEDAPPTLFMDFLKAATPEAILDLYKRIEDQVEARSRALDQWNSSLDDIQKVQDAKAVLRTEILHLKESEAALTRERDAARDTVDRLAEVLGNDTSLSVVASGSAHRASWSTNDLCRSRELRIVFNCTAVGLRLDDVLQHPP